MRPYEAIAALLRERDEQSAREAALSEAHREEKERADLLAEALHGSYGTEHRWRLACEQALAERDRAREEAHALRNELNLLSLRLGRAPGDCLKKEEEEAPSLTNVRLGEQAK